MGQREPVDRGRGEAAIHAAVGPNRQRHTVERQDFPGPSHVRGHSDFGRVLQQALRARLDPRVAGLTRNLDHTWRRRRHQRRAVQVDRRHYFSRITPNVRPATMYLRAITIRMSGTDMAMTPDAAMSFQMISNWVTSPWTPTGNVWECGVAVRISAKRNSLHAKVKTMVAAAMSPGAASGSSTRRKEVHRLAPSTRAASSSSIGISARKPFNIQMANGKLNSE